MKLSLILITSVLLVGCSNAPSSSDIEKALEADIDTCKNVEIVDVKKINGYPEEGLYRVEYEAALEVKNKGELKKLHDTWRDEYERVQTVNQAHEDFEAQIRQLDKEADALRATVGPEPQRSDFYNLERDYHGDAAYSAAKEAWRKRGEEAARPKLHEIEQLRQQWLQRPSSNFVIVGNESEVTMNFFLKGCSLQAMGYVRGAIPDMRRDSDGLTNPEMRLSFKKSHLKGEMTMRKTENGWQKI